MEQLKLHGQHCAHQLQKHFLILFDIDFPLTVLGSLHLTPRTLGEQRVLFSWCSAYEEHLSIMKQFQTKNLLIKTDVCYNLIVFNMRLMVSNLISRNNHQC